MTIYVDENIPYYLADGFNTLVKNEGLRTGIHIEVKSIEGRFGKGATDEEWIPVLGKEGAVVLTRDFHISKRKNQIELCKQYGLGIIFLKDQTKKTGLSVMEMVAKLALKWSAIQACVHERKPFLKVITQSNKLEDMPL